MGNQLEISVAGDNTGQIAGRDINITYEGDTVYDVRGLENPYLGLAAFTYAERDRYAGREIEVEQALNLLTTPGRERPLLFITGASGSGKSSFAQAGLLPVLKAHYQALDYTVAWALFRPGEQPLAGLARALHMLKRPVTGIFAPADEYMIGTPTEPADQNQIAILIIDQFEEIFTQSDIGQGATLLEMLTALPDFRDATLHVITTMRADYLRELFEFPTLYDIAKTGIDLRAMDEEALKVAIQRPLQAMHPDRGKRFQNALLNELAEDAAEDAALLPLLQVTLDDLWRTGILTADYYTDLAAALRRRADEIYSYHYDTNGNQLPRSEEEKAELLGILLDLVEVSLDDDVRRDVRRTRRMDDVVRNRPVAERLIQELTTARLLATDEKPVDDSQEEVETVDIIHESLITNWSQLRAAIQTQRDHLRQRRRFELRLDEWLEHERSTDYLLSGVHLAEAEELQRLQDITLSPPAAQRFISESVKQRHAKQQQEIERQKALVEEQRQRAETERESAQKLRRRALLLGAALTLAVAAIVVSIFSFRAQSRQTIIARASQLATEVSLLLGKAVPEHGSILETAIAAVTLLAKNNIEISQPVEQALRSAIAASRLLDTYRPPINTTYQALSLSPDNKLIVTGNQDGTIHIYPIIDGDIQEPRIVRGHSNMVVDLSSIREHLVASIGHEAIVWNIAEGTAIYRTAANNYREFAIEISPDAKTLAIGGTGHIRLYDLGQFTDQTILNQPTKWLRLETSDQIRDIRFDRSGKLLLTGGTDNVMRLWDLTRNTIVWQSEILPKSIGSVDISPDGSMLAASVNDQLFLWRNRSTIPNGNIEFGSHDYVGEHQSYIRQINFSPNGLCLVTSSADRLIRVWNTSALSIEYILDGHTDIVHGTAFSNYMISEQPSYFTKCGENLYSVGADQTIRTWNVSAPIEIATATDFAQPIEAMDLLNDVTLATADQAGKLSIWDSATLDKYREWSHSADRLGDVKFMRNGKLLVSAGYDNRIVFWDWQKGSQVDQYGTLTNSEDDILFVNFNKEGDKLLSGGRDSMLRIWDLTMQKVVQKQQASGDVLDAEFNPMNEDLLAVATFADVRLFNLANNQSWILDKSETHDVEFFHNGNFLVTAGASGIRLWAVNSGSTDIEQPIHLPIEETPNVFTVALTESDDLLLAGTEDGKLISWSLKDLHRNSQPEGRLIHQLELGINDVVIDAEAGHVIVACKDGTLRIFTLEIEELIKIAKELRQNYSQQ